MPISTREAKRELRDKLLAQARRIPEQQRASASALARALLKAQGCWRDAQSILFFAPLPGEPDVWPLLGEALALGKEVALPRFAASAPRYEAGQVLDPVTDVERGHFGIREPLGRCARFALDRLELILVPGVAFDLRGGRLGRGKGYYDQLLVGLHGTRCGVAFDEQIVAEVPMDAHDARMNCILTPTRWVDVKS